jgi:hypothetical protein
LHRSHVQVCARALLLGPNFGRRLDLPALKDSGKTGIATKNAGKQDVPCQEVLTTTRAAYTATGALAIMVVTEVVC